MEKIKLNFSEFLPKQWFGLDERRVSSD